MLYRIKDFEQVYSISENKFKIKEDDYSLKRAIEDVVEIANNDIKKKGIELTINHSNSLPPTSRGDQIKFKQIFLNLLTQSINGTYRGVVKIRSENTYVDHIPHIAVEIDNSKFELHKKDNQRIQKLT